MDFGWGPTSMIQWLLEHIHVYSDTPWWASILITTLVVRAGMFYPFMRSSNEQAKIAAMKPALDVLKDKYKKAKAESDPITQQEATQKHALELRRLNAAFGISYPMMLTPMFLQMVAGFASFRLLRNMTFSHIPGLDEGGFLWLMDLTVADPYYTLPVLSAGLMHLTARVRSNPSSGDFLC